MEPRYVELLIAPDLIQDAAAIRAMALDRLGLNPDDPTPVRVVRRSLAARSRMPRLLLKRAVGAGETARTEFRPGPPGDRRVVVVGAGPGG